MNDLQIVRLVDVVPVHRIGNVPDRPGFLRLTGAGFDGASLVRLNGLEAPSFEILTLTVMDVEIPAALLDEVIRTVDVLSDRFTGAEKNRMEFLLGTSVRTVAGLLKAIQQYVTVLTTTPGTDIFHPERGGGLLTLLGTNLDPSAPSTYTGPIMTAVDRATRQVISSQLSRRMPPDEKLRAVSILDLRFEKPSLTLFLRLGFETLAGTRAVAGVSVGQQP